MAHLENNFNKSSPPTFSSPRPSGRSLEELVLECHVVLWLETNTGTEDVGKCSTLLGEGVDNRSTGRSEGSLEHVAEQRQDAVHGLVLAIASRSDCSSRRGPINQKHTESENARRTGDASEQLAKNSQIQDQRRSEKRVLADVEHGDGLLATHHDIGRVCAGSATCNQR